MKKEVFSVQFVCLGNICRSPLAHAVFLDRVKKRGLEKKIQIESSGLGSWHIGQLPDSRMRAVARDAGYHMDHRARKIFYNDIASYDLILAMDHTIYQDLQRMARTETDREKIQLFREYDPIPQDKEVPDPYYGGKEGFLLVLELVERTCDSLLDFILHQLE